MITILSQYHTLWIQGFFTTVKLLFFIMIIGIPLGVLLGIIGGRFDSFLKNIVKKIYFITKVIPVLVLLFWFHYPLQNILHIVVNPFLTTLFVLSMINSISIASILIQELELLPLSYRESGMVMGMKNSQIIKYIELPILLRRIIPQVLTLQASMLEYTLLASLISVPELFKTAQSINAMIYRPVEIYSLLAVFFLIILGSFHLCIHWINKKYIVRYD